MPILHGTFSVQRFSTATRRDTPFDHDDIRALNAHAFGTGDLSDSETPHGWGGGHHELDTTCSAEKNMRGDFLHFSFVAEEEKLPAGRIKALAQIEYDAANGKVRWFECLGSATAQVEEEGKDGRYKTRKVVPVVYDRSRNQVWFGHTSDKYAGLFADLFEVTFGKVLQPITAGSFWVGDEPDHLVPVWVEDGKDDWLGNDFLMWLLARNDHELIGKAVVSVRDTVQLACPIGEKGRVAVNLECPTRMPELVRAVREGKVARKAGVTVVTGDGQHFDFTLAAEGWRLSGVKVPDPDDGAKGDVAELARLELCRTLFDTVDGLMNAFTDGYEDNMRLVNEWTNVGEEVTV